MIEINLLPKELRPKKVSGFAPNSFDLSKLSRLDPRIASAWVLGAVLVLQAMLFAAHAYVNAEYKRLKGKNSSLSVSAKEIASLKSQLTSVSERFKSIDNQARRQFSWAEKLNALSDAITPEIWLTDLTYEEKIVERPAASPVKGGSSADNSKKQNTVPVKEKAVSRSLIITGCVYSTKEDQTACIGRFIQNLKENNAFYRDFGNIAVEDIKGGKFGGQDIMVFRVTCSFKEF